MFTKSIESLSIGGTPVEEACAAIGVTEGAQELNKLECRAYIQALIKKFGQPPKGAEFRVKGNPHDFGTYYEVECRYDGADREAADYAQNAEKGVALWEDVGMWPPVTYDNNQAVNILREPELWSRDSNPQCFPTMERLRAARDELLARDADAVAPPLPLPINGVVDWGDATSPFILVAGLPIHRKADGSEDRCWDYAGGHLGFYGYLRSCDATFQRRTGFSIFDMPDHTWRDAYDERQRPRDAIEEFQANGGEE